MSQQQCPDPYPHAGHQWHSGDGKIYSCNGVPKGQG